VDEPSTRRRRLVLPDEQQPASLRSRSGPRRASTSSAPIEVQLAADTERELVELETVRRAEQREAAEKAAELARQERLATRREQDRRRRAEARERQRGEREALEATVASAYEDALLEAERRGADEVRGELRVFEEATRQRESEALVLVQAHEAALAEDAACAAVGGHLENPIKRSPQEAAPAAIELSPPEAALAGALDEPPVAVLADAHDATQPSLTPAGSGLSTPVSRSRSTRPSVPPPAISSPPVPRLHPSAPSPPPPPPFSPPPPVPPPPPVAESRVPSEGRTPTGWLPPSEPGQRAPDNFVARPRRSWRDRIQSAFRSMSEAESRPRLSLSAPLPTT
jgi:hypothetical protein